VLAGSNTYLSLPAQVRPLPGRENIVLTRHPNRFNGEGVGVITSFDDIIERARFEDVWVIGGAEVYKTALAHPHLLEMHLTRIHANVQGDTRFPEWNAEEWTLVSSIDHPADEKNEYPFTWEIYRRRHRYIEMANCRTDDQKLAMYEILDLEICPFCPENRRRWHLKDDAWSGIHWVASENMWPYPWAKDGGVHMILFLKHHVENAAQIPPGAWEELGTIVKEMESRFDIPGGGLFMRFGDCSWTGATIRHIHAHIGQRRNIETPAMFYLS
jgi:dihydrofolate reductase